MNLLNYEKALEKDDRTFCQYYLSLLKTKHILIFSFFQFKDYNAQMIKIYIFFYTFAINYVVSAMFYSDATMYKIYVDHGSFDFTYQLPKMIYSLLISILLKFLLNFLGLYEKEIMEMKNNEIVNKNMNRIYFKIKCKIISFFVITYIFNFLLWFYLGCFCAVYMNTQIHLFFDVISSFALSFITPFIIYLLPGILRIPALKDKSCKKRLMFKFSRILQNL